MVCGTRCTAQTTSKTTPAKSLLELKVTSIPSQKNTHPSQPSLFFWIVSYLMMTYQLSNFKALLSVQPVCEDGWLLFPSIIKAIKHCNQVLKTVISPASLWGWLGNGREPLLQAIHLTPSHHQLVESSVYDQTKSLPLIVNQQNYTRSLQQDGVCHCWLLHSKWCVYEPRGKWNVRGNLISNRLKNCAKTTRRLSKLRPCWQSNNDYHS